MDERQNKNGTWIEAEPIKASWETNRLLQLFKKFKNILKEKRKNEQRLRG